MKQDRVLIIDDDVELCRLLNDRLQPEGFAIETIQDGQTGLKRATLGQHDLIILDLMLPGMSGLDVLRNLRSHSSVPVLILTARGDDVDRILGLEIGADDYLPKPFNPRELVARIRAILRRVSRDPDNSSIVIVDNVRLEPSSLKVWVNETELSVTSLEFNLLETFMRSAGQVMTREDLTEQVLGRKLGPFDRVIDVHVSNLRKKLARISAEEYIKAVRGMGYLFVTRSRSR
ncbi:response regulator transcription factor [Edaphobacter albus]|uniref:response regulator transcription factor n=1 Tax=Edaphobacter sp. 4G125 TaxID=2763071 RepID=UPI00164466D0|nr:response regulator transcription factor [Edaphobacter sp. 4G125]QNI35235.1 response regulator transcription factor [Edaphobacter sp. 4G125]